MRNGETWSGGDRSLDASCCLPKPGKATMQGAWCSLFYFVCVSLSRVSLPDDIDLHASYIYQKAVMVPCLHLHARRGRWMATWVGEAVTRQHNLTRVKGSQVSQFPPPPGHQSGGHTSGTHGGANFIVASYVAGGRTFTSTRSGCKSLRWAPC